MTNLPKKNDIVVHRESGCQYKVAAVSLEDNHFGSKVWKFEVIEMDSPRQSHYLLLESDIGPVDSKADYYLQTRIANDSHANFAEATNMLGKRLNS